MGIYLCIRPRPKPANINTGVEMNQYVFSLLSTGKAPEEERIETLSPKDVREKKKKKKKEKKPKEEESSSVPV